MCSYFNRAEQSADAWEQSLSKVTPHCFRHTLATTLLRNGCPIEHVQKMLGHSKISTTMIYARINDEEVKRNHDRYSI